jgi:putative nucleotidyltransferase with HDIG domain
VICLAITKLNFPFLAEIVADFLHNLHPDDIRLIPVAQEHFTPEDHAYYDQTIRPQLLKLASETYPFLRYRINNFFTVRGLHNTSLEKCYVVLDERTVGGADIYPCNIYIRERGNPITSVTDPNQNETIWRWFLTHNCLQDPICVNYCCDVTREYNLMIDRSLQSLTRQQVFHPQNMLAYILQETPIQEQFQQFQDGILAALDTHLKRTALNAGYLGTSLNWHFLTVYYLMRAALLHDIGKSHNAIQRLNCIPHLDPSQKDVLRQHTFYGKELLNRMGYPVEGEIACYHHERIDGSGYQHIHVNWPMAEIVALADAYTALTEDRGGRPKCSPSEAVSLIRAGECGPFRGTYLNALQNSYERKLLC